jgi:hypothetical protein
MVRWVGLACLLAAAACYSPHPAAGAACAPGNTCPDPLVCVLSPTGPVCEPVGTVFADASTQHDAPLVDAPPDSNVVGDGRMIDSSTPPPGPMLIQQATNKSASASTVSTTFVTAPAAGNLLVMVGAANGGMLDTVTGGGVTTWSQATGNYDNANVEIWYGITDGSSSTVTISRSVNFNNMWIVISEWSGMAAASPLDVASSRGGLSSTASVPLITTLHAHDVLIFGVGNTEPGASVGAPAPGTWTAMDTAGPTPDYIQYSWYREVTTATSYQPTVSANGCGWDAAVAAFKAAN